MSENQPVIPRNVGLTPEQIEKIGGGSCTVEEYIEILGDLKDTYDTLVDFTSYVIERVATSTP